MIEYAVVTVSRPQGYVHQTIASLEETGFFGHPDNLPLRLVVGSPDSAYLERYRERADRFRVEEMSAEEARGFGLDRLYGSQRCALTHSRCLGDGRIDKKADLVMVMEDDIRFALGWFARLQLIIEDVMRSHPRGWALSLYTPNSDEPLVCYRRGEKWLRRNYDFSFFGLQAMVYPRWIAAGFADFVMQNNVLKYVKPCDHLLIDFMKDRGLPILATAPSLVQHIGELSMGVSADFHQSNSFLDSVV